MEPLNFKHAQNSIVDAFFDIQMLISPHINASPHHNLILTNFAKTCISFIKAFELLAVRAKKKPYIRVYVRQIVDYFRAHVLTPARAFFLAHKHDITANAELIDLKLLVLVR